MYGQVVATTCGLPR